MEWVWCVGVAYGVGGLVGGCVMLCCVEWVGGGGVCCVEWVWWVGVACGVGGCVVFCGVGGW